MRVLVACEFSGVVRDEFIARGHDAYSCDLLESETPGPHYQGNVFDIINEGWDLMIAHPPCTYLSNSGVCWLKTDPTRHAKMVDGAEFFKKLLNANIPKIAVENPVMHGYAKTIIGATQTQVIQPWMFGHMEQKATCLWLKGLPPLVPTRNVRKKMLTLPMHARQRLHYLSPGPERAHIRSITFKGIARAFAEQWG